MKPYYLGLGTRVLPVVLLALLASAAWGQTGPIQTEILGAGEADKIHLILTGYTAASDNDIGPDCRADLVAVQQMFSLTFRGPWRKKLEVHPLYGDPWTADKVRHYLKTMQIGPNDVVVFYHAGHGSILDPNMALDTHLLQVHAGGRLSRGEIRRLLAARGRGLVMLTDTCSSVPFPVHNRGPAQVQAEARFNRQTIRHLFLLFQGVVDITAADIGTTAGNTRIDEFAGARGAFTVAFLLLASSDHVFNDWTEFFPALRDQTRTSSGGTQQPYAFSLPLRPGDKVTVTPKRPRSPSHDQSPTAAGRRSRPGVLAGAGVACQD